MSTSDLGLRIVDTLTDLFERGKLTYEQYQAQLAAAHDRSLAAESSLSPSGKLKRAVVVEKVGRQVPTKSAKQERCARQVVSEKKVVPEVGVSVSQEKKSKWVQERDQGVIIPGVKVSATKGMIENVAVKSTEMEGDRSDEKGKRSQSSTGSIKANVYWRRQGGFGSPTPTSKDSSS